MAGALTRRALLTGAAGATGAALLGRRAAAALPAPAGPPTSMPLLKGVSLIGDVNRYDDALGVRPYLLGGPRPTDVVALWVDWAELQGRRPDPFARAQAWRELSDPAAPAAWRVQQLDAQIARANADGRRVLLTVYQRFPRWTSFAGALALAALDPGRGGVGYPGQGRREHAALIPDDLGEDGPWAWFVAWLCARYADTGGTPTAGPGIGGARVGNPAAARIDWLAPMNEPNLVWWPQRSVRHPAGTAIDATARMMRTAAAVAADVRAGAALGRGPALLMPNTADVVADDAGFGTPWRRFTVELLERLRGWRPPTAVGWAQHNYADVKHGPQADGPGRGRWRVEETLALLVRGGWPTTELWLTEGGYHFAVRRASPRPNHFVVAAHATADGRHRDVFAEQVACLTANWSAMARLPVRLWTQYLVHDDEVHFQSGLRGPVRWTATGALPHDPPYPAYALADARGLSGAVGARAPARRPGSRSPTPGCRGRFCAGRAPRRASPRRRPARARPRAACGRTRPPP